MSATGRTVAARCWWWVRYGDRPDRRGQKFTTGVGPSGMSVECTIVSKPNLRPLWWWTRYVIRYAPVHGWRRAIGCCRSGCDPNDLYDMRYCMSCGRDMEKSDWRKMRSDVR